MKEYIEMWKRFSDFSGTTDVKGYWMALLIDFLFGFTLGFLGVYVGLFDFIGNIYMLAVLIPELALFVRRMRDAGKSWANLFWIFLPIAGWIVLIIKLCAPSQYSPANY